jgi:hypothetical protein
VAQLTSKGQKKETGEDVNNKSATTWDRIIRKQFIKVICGKWDESLQTMDTRTPVNKANTTLWVGPRWNVFAFPWKRSPTITSISGRFARTKMKRATFHRLRAELFFGFKSWVTNPMAAWANGNGMKSTP